MRRIALTLVASLSLTVPANAGTPAQAVADSHRSAAHRALDESRNPAAVLTFADYHAGQTIADVMAGDGYFTEMLADIVGPGGQVIAVNPPNFHEADKWAPVLAAHANMSVLLSDPRAFQFAPNSLDSLFFHLTYHDLYWESEQYHFPHVEPSQLVANWFRALRSGGTVVVIDHVGPAGDTRDVVERMHRIDPAVVRHDFERAGFVFDGSSDALANSADDHSLLVFNPAIRGHTDRFMMRFSKP